MEWVIYYGDYSTYSNKDGDPFHAPPSNVQVVVNDGGIQYSKDNYYWKPELGWCGCDMAGLYDYLQQYHEGPKAVLFGRSIRNDDFWDIVKRVIKERDEAKVG